MALRINFIARVFEILGWFGVGYFLGLLLRYSFQCFTEETCQSTHSTNDESESESESDQNLEPESTENTKESSWLHWPKKVFDFILFTHSLIDPSMTSLNEARMEATENVTADYENLKDALEEMVPDAEWIDLISSYVGGHKYLNFSKDLEHLKQALRKIVSDDFEMHDE